ncbi:hypothetical protein Tco_0609060 [Tanacetum coccineum]
MDNRLTTDGIKYGLFKKKENAGNKRRSNDQNKNRGRDERNKRQRTGGNFALTVPEQGKRRITKISKVSKKGLRIPGYKRFISLFSFLGQCKHEEQLAEMQIISTAQTENRMARPRRCSLT